MLTWKLRIMVLWLILAVCQSAGIILAMFEPGVIRDMMAGQWQSVGVQVWTATFWLGPLVLAYLTLVLKDAANRRTNAMLGAVAAVSGVLGLVDPLAGAFGAGAVFIGLVQVLVTLLIVWHAWKWPRSSGVTPPQQTVTTLR